MREPISIKKLSDIAQKQFGDLVKAVVDVERALMAIGGELHADAEALLIEQSSKQADLWGINLYPAIEGEDWIEFDSMINLRPAQGNRTRSVDVTGVRDRIIQTVGRLVPGG